MLEYAILREWVDGREFVTVCVGDYNGDGSCQWEFDISDDNINRLLQVRIFDDAFKAFKDSRIPELIAMFDGCKTVAEAVEVLENYDGIKEAS